MATARSNPRRKAIPPVYTYRGGRKVPLRKEADRFVVRAVGAAVAPLAARSEQQVSSASTRVEVRAAELERKMAQSRKIAPTHHAYRVADTDAEFLISDRVMVRFKPGTREADVDALAAKYALVVRERFGPTEYLFQLTDHTGINPVKLVVALTEREPTVALAENDLNQRMRRRAYVQPTDTHYLRSWHLHSRFVHAEFDPRSSSRCEQAWQLLDGFGTPDVVISVSDDGCRLDHGDFNDGKFAGWAYFKGTRLVTGVDPDADPALMYQSGSNHGTSCAGVAAGEVDGTLTVGAAPGCRLLPVKWESDETSLYTSDSKLRKVLDWIADKADVMSNSWGIVPDNLFAQIVTDRIGELSSTGGRRGRGIVFLWAAGNEDCPIQFTGNVDIPYDDGWGSDAAGNPRWVGVSRARRFRNTLVGLPGVMHVAALASNGRRSHYSNYGTGLDVTAPTSNSHAFWRMSVPGIGIVAPTGEGQRFTVAFGGTSSATPLVAGIAGLVISANPLLSAAEVISILRRTASKDLDLAGYARTPPASFDPDTSWDVSPVAPFANGAFVDGGHPDGTWSAWFGHGKVDAERAVAAAIAARGAPEPGNRAQFAASSEPGLPIPDHQAGGASDVVHLDGQGEVGAVRLDVGITHTYIGDLVVTLRAPNGRTAIVHDRQGAGTRNLRRTFTNADTPALSHLLGSPIRGEWRLGVVDTAQADTGRLDKWTLVLGARSASDVVRSDNAGASIPDNSAAGLTRTIAIDTPGTIADIAVDVDITHGWVGDLLVALTPPTGERIVLHDRAGGSADQLIDTWSGSDTTALSALIGKVAAGPWKLSVADLAASDVGKLNRWELRLTIVPPSP